MKKADYIIVGGGFAGIFFAHQLLKHHKSFILFHNNRASGSHISAGVCNPVILKRFSAFWKSSEQLEYLVKFFSEIEKYLGKNYLINEPVARIFHDEEEKKQWCKNSQKADLKAYLNNDFIRLKTVENPFGAGIVRRSCRINVKAFFADFFHYLDTGGYLFEEDFEYDKINAEKSCYKDFEFKNIVFCEGVFLKHNPFFNDIPMQPNKGHCFEVEVNDSVEPYIIKKKHFLFSLDENLYYYGGTYDRFDLTNEINEKSVLELDSGLKEFYKNSFKIKKINTAFRATVADRKPILGRHPHYSNFYIFNGLGARGVLNGSYFSRKIFNFIENNIRLDSEVDVGRFYKSLQQS